MAEGESDLIDLPFGIEMDIAHACNLHCRNCSHYSNYGLKGVVPLAQGIPWLSAVSKRLRPKTFYLLGGEPVLNRQLCDYLWLASELWPDIERGMVSNGLLLDRQPDLRPTLAATGSILQISHHTQPPDQYRAAIAKARAMADQHGVKLIVRENRVLFYSTYRGEGAAMRPFDDGSPARSWAACCEKFCLTLFRGRLWKCPPIAYLRLVSEKFGLDSVPEWQPYLAYAGLDVHSSKEQYKTFLNANFAPESICGMCPVQLEFFSHRPDETAPPSDPTD